MTAEKKAEAPKPTAREQIQADLESYLRQRRAHMEAAYQARAQLEDAEKRIAACDGVIAGLQVALSKHG